MKTYTAIILAALAAVVNAVQITNSVINPEPGKPFEITWSGATGSVTILLKDGPSTALETVATLVSGATGGSATITLDAADYPSGTYAFEIVDSADPSKPNYSEQFSFVGTGTGPTSAAGSTSRAASSSGARTSVTGSAPTASQTQSQAASTTSAARPSRTSDADEDEETTVPGSSAGRVASPLALVLVTVAAMFYLN